MRLNLRLCVSLALFSTFYSQVSHAERFNNVIDDFDSYLQSENEGKKTKSLPAEVPLNISTQAQGYDVLATLSPVPVAKEKEKRQTSTVKQQKIKEKKNDKRPLNTVVVSESLKIKSEEQIKPSETEISTVSEVYPLATNTQSYQPIILSSYPSIFQNNQWNPKYLAKDFAKYQVVLDPLGLYSTKFTKQAGIDNSAYLAQLASLIEQQQLKNLYRFGIAQGIGELISYNNLLTDGQLVSQLIHHNKSVAELNYIITEKQFAIDKLNEELVANRQQIEQLQGVVKSVDNKLIVDELNKELVKVRKEIAEKQNNLTELSVENKQSKETIQQLEKQLSDGVAEFANAKQQLIEKDKYVIDANQRIEQLTTEITKLQSDAQQQLQLSGKTDEQLKLLNVNLLKQEELLKQKEEDFKLAQTQKNDVQLALKQQQDVVKSLEQKNQQLTEQIQQKNSVETDLTAAQKQLADAKAQLQAQQTQAEQKLASLGQTSDKQVKTLTDKNQQLALQLASQVAQLSEKSNLETELAIAKKQQVEQKNNQERLTKQLTDSQNQQDLLQTQLAANEKSYIDTQSQLKQANSQVQKLQKDLEKQTALVGKASDKQIKDLTSDLSKQISLLEQREAELAKLGADKQGIQDALTAQLSDKKKLESQNSKLVAQAKDQEKQISQLETDLANRNKQQSDIEQRLLDANKQLNELKLEAQKFTAENTGKQNQELDKLKKQLDDKVLADTKVQKELTKAKESLKKAEDELVSLKSFSTDDGLKSQIRDLNQRVMQLRKENDSLKSAQTHQAQSSGKTPSIIKIPAKDTNSVAQENAKRNQKIIQDINQQKYSKLDSHTYYKVLQKGAPISNVADKQITIIMREQLTDGKVTVMHTEQNPMVLAYNQLPPPLNMFVDKIGVGGMVKVYIEPEGGYGVDGVPGTIPPNSMSIIDFKVISAK